MEHDTHVIPHNMDEYEVAEWLESLDSVLESSGPEVAVEILERLRVHAKVAGLNLPFTANTPYVNTIPARLEAPFPGDQELERRIKSLIRWNAIAMVVRANRVDPDAREPRNQDRPAEGPEGKYERPDHALSVRTQKAEQPPER